MTLVVVLMLGLGAVLVVSAFETDPATGHSVSVAKTIADVWNGSVDFTQPGQQQGIPPAPGGGSQLPGGNGSTVPGLPGVPTIPGLPVPLPGGIHWPTLADTTGAGLGAAGYQSAVARDYLQRQQQSQRTA